MTDWDDLEALLLELATGDLTIDGEICPSLAAYRGAAPLLVGFLRSFPKGEYHDPVIELLALAIALGADRLVFSAGARVWSMDDPVPPVLPGVGDLRQRVLTITAVDGTGGTIDSRTTLHPFELAGGTVQWGDALRERGQGWLAEAMELALRSRSELPSDVTDARAQARRCATLGHRLAFSPEVADLLAVDAGRT